MNILFISLVDFDTLEEHNIYTDLLREFVKNDHKVFALSPIEKQKNQKERIIDYGGYVILKPVIGNIQKTNYIEKGISTITLEPKLIRFIKRKCCAVKFDLVIYTTPPITFQKVIEFIKKRDGAAAYLLLKDIFPQSAVDLGALSPKGAVYKFFRFKEKRLYKAADYIGCMSKANKKYVLENNGFIDRDKIEICPNSMEPNFIHISEIQKEKILKKYELPVDKKILIYGGNLGKPQGIDFLIECIECCERQDIFFVVAGNGTEYKKLEQYSHESRNENIKVLKSLPRNEYELLTKCCDVGIILLDKRFTIPNFPSRLLSYMQAGIPVLAATDYSTDIGEIIEKGRFGYWCIHGEKEVFLNNIDKIVSIHNYDVLCKNSHKYFLEHYTVKKGYEIIMKHFS